MQVPLLDLAPQYRPLRDELREAIDRVVESQRFILGPEVEGFERDVCAFTGAPHAIGMSSGTDAQLALLMALDVCPGDTVLTSPYSFFATAGCIARLGAKPHFVDIDPDTYLLSPSLLSKALESPPPNLKAIMPVHLFGLMARMDEIRAAARSAGVPVIEDAAQALGASYPSADGPLRAGNCGDAAFFSFFPSKNLGCFGDGGMATCQDASLAHRTRILRNHGMEPQYYHALVGGNFRLDALQAAVLRVKLPHLDRWSLERRENARRYRTLFAELDLDSTLGLPTEPYAAANLPTHHIYNQFVIRAPRRDDLCKHLSQHGVGHAIYYPVPLHLQPCFRHLGYRPGDFPEAERAAAETIALPIYPGLTPDQQSHVARTIRAFYR